MRPGNESRNRKRRLRDGMPLTAHGKRRAAFGTNGANGANGSARVLATRAAAALRRVVPFRPEQTARDRDSLTGLFDGRALQDALASAMADAERRGEDMGLLFLDLDHFKRINDQHGHLAGSRILRQVAMLLRIAADNAGGLAARYGGDEFALVLPGKDLGQAFRQAEQLRLHVASTLFSSGPGAGARPEVSLTCSVGAASLRRLSAACSGADSELDAGARLLRAADDAMYRAKRAGRNRVVATGAAAGTA